MFTGITQGLFKVTEIIKKPDLMIYKVCLSKELVVNLKIGASIAINGICQTVTEIDNTIVTFNAIKATLEKTTLSSLKEGTNVSVERSLRFGDEIGGHEVSGHITGTAKVSSLETSLNNLTMHIQCSEEWMKYIFPQGFIALDGSSLTVDKIDINDNAFTVNLIPETLRVTNFSNKRVGDLVNLELDNKTRIIVDSVDKVLTARLRGF